MDMKKANEALDRLFTNHSWRTVSGRTMTSDQLVELAETRRCVQSERERETEREGGGGGEGEDGEGEDDGGIHLSLFTHTSRCSCSCFLSFRLGGDADAFEKKLTRAEIRLVFERVKLGKRKAIDFDRFKEAVRQMAVAKQVTFVDLVQFAVEQDVDRETMTRR
jgi:hypothetical protein